MMSIPREVFEKYAVEYQSKIADSSRQLAVARAQLQNRERERRLNQLTATELGNLPAETVSYRSVGKMFLQENLGKLKSELDSGVENATKELSVLERAVTKLENEKKEAEKNLRSLIAKATGEKE